MVILQILVMTVSFAILILFWAVPIVYGIETAKHRGFSPHWMWFGLYPGLGWMIWGILACLRQCPVCGKVMCAINKFCPACSTSLVPGEDGTVPDSASERSGQGWQTAAGPSGTYEMRSMDAKLDRLKRILREAARGDGGRSREIAEAAKLLRARAGLSDPQPMDEAALEQEVSQLLTELESTPAGKAAQANENWWTLTSDINQCPNCHSVIEIHESFCGACGAPAPRILCPYCGSHATKVETRRLTYALPGTFFAILAGICAALGDANIGHAMQRVAIAGTFVFGGVAAAYVWFEVSARTKWLVCRRCHRTSKIDPKTARWWTAEPAGSESPEQDPREAVEDTAGV